MFDKKGSYKKIFVGFINNLMKITFILSAKYLYLFTNLPIKTYGGKNRPSL